MATKRQPRMTRTVEPKGAKTGKLMDNQDTRTKGDGEDIPSVMTSILLPLDLKKEAQAYGKANHITLTALIIEGLKDRLAQG